MARKIIYTTGFKAPVQKVGLEKATEWVNYRYEFWRRYTLNSVLNQSNSNWEYWLIVNEDSLKILGDGRISQILSDERIRIVPREDQSAGFKAAQGDHDFYMVLRLDSDDMYHKDVTDEMMSVEVSDSNGLYRYVQYTHGYVYKPRNRKLKEWWRRHMSPPFFAMVYPRNLWDRKIANNDGSLFDGGHEQVRVHRRKLLGPGKFCVCIQDMNMVTTIGKREEITDEEEKKRILKNFSVNYPESDFLESGTHDIFNLIPGGWGKTKNE